MPIWVSWNFCIILFGLQTSYSSWIHSLEHYTRTLSHFYSTGVTEEAWPSVATATAAILRGILNNQVGFFILIDFSVSVPDWVQCFCEAWPNSTNTLRYLYPYFDWSSNIDKCFYEAWTNSANTWTLRESKFRQILNNQDGVFYIFLLYIFLRPEFYDPAGL